ncbi:hypothetical protein Tco_1216937 [Tanacetum coccineum]
MLGSEYGEQDRKAAVLYEYEIFKATEGELLLDTYIRYLQNLLDINIDALYNILKQNQGDVNDAMKSKKKAVVITSDPLALVAEQTKVRKRKEKVVASSESEGSDDELKKITALLAKAFNRKKLYSKPTNNNLRTSLATSSTNKKQEYVKFDDKKEEKKTKMLLAKKDSDEQVLLAEDHAWMESSSDSDQEINANMVFMAQMEKVLSDSEESSSSKDGTIAEIADQEILFDKMSRQLVELDENVRMLKNTVLEKDLKISELNECNGYLRKGQNRSQTDKTEHENGKSVKQESKDSFKTISVRNKGLEIEKCLERLNECENKLHKIGQTNLTIHMIMSSKDKMYNGRKGIGFENPSYFCKAKDLRPTLYDERVIGLGYTSRFLTHSDEALEIEKFKRARENKIAFAYDYGNLNASYVNEKINFLDDYFQEIINPKFEKIDSPFQQTSSLKPYVPTVILEKIIIDLEDEVVSLLNKEKENLEIIESLKSKEKEKSFESSEKAISDSENQSENDCQLVEKGCDNVENPKVIAPRIFKLKVSQSVSPVSVSKTSCASKKKDIFHIVSGSLISGISKHMTSNRAPFDKLCGNVSWNGSLWQFNDVVGVAGYEMLLLDSMTVRSLLIRKVRDKTYLALDNFVTRALKVAYSKV